MLKYDNKSLYNKFEFIQKKISEQSYIVSKFISMAKERGSKKDKKI